MFLVIEQDLNVVHSNEYGACSFDIVIISDANIYAPL